MTRSRTGKSVCLLFFVFTGVIYLRGDDWRFRPNVILFMDDDQGWGDTGYNGHPHLNAPHLGRMSPEGVTFKQFLFGRGDVLANARKRVNMT